MASVQYNGTVQGTLLAMVQYNGTIQGTVVARYSTRHNGGKVQYNGTVQSTLVARVQYNGTVQGTMVARAAAAVEERMVGKRSIGVPTYSCTVASFYLQIIREKVKLTNKK